MSVTRYWVHGALYLTRDECERNCRVLHPRLGIVEASREVVDASVYLALEQENATLKAKIATVDMALRKAVQIISEGVQVVEILEAKLAQATQDAREMAMILDRWQEEEQQ